MLDNFCEMVFIDHMTICIRDAQEDELDIVLKLVDEAYAPYRDLLPANTWKLWSDGMRKTLFSGDGEVVVAEFEAAIAGAVHFFSDVTPFTLVRWPEGAATLRMLSVRDDMKGKGVGSMLMDECLRRARRCGSIGLYLLTTAYMKEAKRLYQRMGFIPCSGLDLSAFPPEEQVEAYYLALEKANG